MSSRPLCDKCNEYMCLSGCQCKESVKDVPNDEKPDFFAGQYWF